MFIFDFINLLFLFICCLIDLYLLCIIINISNNLFSLNKIHIHDISVCLIIIYLFLYCSLVLVIYCLLVFVCQFDILIYSISMNMNNSNIINLVHKHNIQVMCIYFSLLIYSSCFNSILVYFSYLCLFFNSLLFRFSLDLLFSMLNVMYLNCLYKLLMLEFNITNYTLMFYNQIIFNL